MKRIGLLVLVGLSVALLSAGISFAAGEKEMLAPEAEMIIKGEKKSARFSHSVHLQLGVSCGQCHHDSQHQPLTDKDIAALESAEKLRCASCHNKDLSNPKLQSPKEAFHARCKECHKQGVAGKTGPTKCSECHVK